jgi:hypothetical protein
MINVNQNTIIVLYRHLVFVFILYQNEIIMILNFVIIIIIIIIIINQYINYY